MFGFELSGCPVSVQMLQTWPQSHNKFPTTVVHTAVWNAESGLNLSWQQSMLSPPNPGRVVHDGEADT